MCLVESRQCFIARWVLLELCAPGLTKPGLLGSPRGQILPGHVLTAVLNMQVTRGEVLVIDRFGGWQAVVLNLLAGLINPADNSFPGDAMAQVGFHSYRLVCLKRMSGW